MESLHNAPPPSNEPPLYNSTIISTFLKLIKARYDFVDISELLSYAEMEPHQVEDDGHWFTQTQVDRFYERAVRATGAHDLARQAGRYTADPTAIGFKARYVLGFIGPANVFSLVGSISQKYTRSCAYHSKKTGKTSIEVIVDPIEGVHEKKYQCENRIGYFEAIVGLFNHRLPRIQHTECVFQGGSCCRYRISWGKSKAERWARVRNISILANIAGLALIPALPRIDFAPALITAAFCNIVLSFIVVSLEKREIRAALTNLRGTTEKLLESVNVNYNNALMINEIGRIISKEVKIDKLLPQIIETLKKRLDYDRGLIMLADASGKKLEYATGFGYDEHVFDELADASFHLDKPESRGIFVVCHREKRPFLINDIDQITDSLSLRSLEFVRKLGAKSFICCPILYEGECLGVLAVDNLKSKRALLESDMNLLMGIAPEIGISVHNALLTEERERQFRSILKTLAASIDARDSLTAGHSENVTEYCMDICREMGVPTEYAEVVRVAAQLHDYGKIGIEDSILKKSGPLTFEEREEIKKHVVKTKEILDRINFNGVYREVPMIAGGHHERMDGSGYPSGLKGEDIPLGSRIIAVADFYEAITARRHYRDPMAGDEAVQALVEARGSHLDSEIVDAFLRILERRALAKPA